MRELTIGTRIYNNGDMANVAHFGTITNIIRNARFGNQYKITPDHGSDRTKPYCVSPVQFSKEYKGHGGTRFVTEKAYREYRDKQIAGFKARMKG